MTDKIEWKEESDGLVFSTHVAGVGVYTVKKRQNYSKRSRERWEGFLNLKPISVAVAADADTAKAIIEERILKAREINSLAHTRTVEPDIHMQDLHSLREAAIVAEAALGENLVWLTDKFDLAIRQGDADALKRLEQLNEAWKGLVKAIGEAS